MTFAKWMLVAGALVTGVIVGVVVYTENTPPPPKLERGAPNDVSREFMNVLPADMSEAQRQEVASLLYIFFARADQGQVKVEDRVEVDNKLREFTKRGSIERSDLARFMAEVSFYAHRLDPQINPPDSSGMHPLLTEEPPDSL